MEKNRHLKLFSDDRGQALVEGAIGIALMSFTWILLTVLSIVTTNVSRTAMASRHAAWLMGNGAAQADIEAKIEGQFFYHAGTLVSLGWNGAEAVDHTADNDDVDSTLDGAEGPYKALVTFGAQTAQQRQTVMPFSLIGSINLPFMPTMDDIDSLYQVDTACQWQQVSDPWHSAGAAIEGIFNSLKNLF